MLCVEEASLNARRIALRDGIARQRPFAITGRGSFFARSGGRTPLVAFDNFIRHRSPYIPSPSTWRISFCHDLSLIRVYIAILEQATRGNMGDTCETERNQLSLRIANLPKPIVTRTFKLLEIIFHGVQYGTQMLRTNCVHKLKSIKETVWACLNSSRCKRACAPTLSRRI